MPYNKELNIYICGRCGNRGFSSIYPSQQDIEKHPEIWKGNEDICTACANYLRFGKGEGNLDQRQSQRS